MTLVETIQNIYPELTSNDFVDIVQIVNNSDGNGDYIAKWEHPTLAQPTQEQLDAVEAGS